jgi:alpha-methylacyl-CoA racemase
LTGYGQTGPRAGRAGHDINYIANAGLLSLVAGPDGTPVIPLNILGDFASGSLLAALGTIMALLERGRTGRGQVVDAAMVDGGALLVSAQLAELAAGIWPRPSTTLLGGSAPFYGVYRCSDDKWFSVGAIEDKFYLELLRALDLEGADLPSRSEPANWPALRKRFAEVFAREPRDHWVSVFEDFDACGAAVLSIEEMVQDKHLLARGSIVTSPAGGPEAAPAPRLSGHARVAGARVASRGRDTEKILKEIGYGSADIAELVSSRTVWFLTPDE